MANPCPMLTRKINVLGRVEDVPGTVKTLTGDDGKARVYAGATPEYAAPREKRDIARGTLTNLGSLESTKALNTTFRVEANTRDTIENLASMDVESILFQSAIAGGAGSIQRVAINGTPDLSAIVAGMYLDLNYSTNASNVGSFLITNVDDGSDFVDVVIRARVDNTDDEASASPSVGDIQNPLDFQWALNSSMAKVIGITRIPIGAITVASYTRNETITGTTSSATARIVVPAETGDTHLYIEPLTGILVTTEVLTGGTSGAVSTSSAGPAVHGHRVVPVSGDNCDAEVSTVEYENAGYSWKGRSSMSNMTIEAGANMAMFMDFAFQGPSSSNGDKTMTTVTRDSEDPPIVKNAELKLDAYLPVFSSFGFDMGNSIAMRVNGNATDGSGFESASVTSREPKVTISLEMELAATFDFFDKLDNGTKTALQMHAGTVTDKMVWFFADEVEFEALPLGDAEGIRTLDLEAMCTGAANGSDDEWEMVFI